MVLDLEAPYYILDSTSNEHIGFSYLIMPSPNPRPLRMFFDSITPPIALAPPLLRGGLTGKGPVYLSSYQIWQAGDVRLLYIFLCPGM